MVKLYVCEEPQPFHYPAGEWPDLTGYLYNNWERNYSRR